MTKRERMERRAQDAKRESERALLQPTEMIANQAADDLAMQEREARHKIEMAFTGGKRVAEVNTAAREFTATVIDAQLQKIQAHENARMIVQNQQTHARFGIAADQAKQHQSMWALFQKKPNPVDPLKIAARETKRRLDAFAKRDEEQARRDAEQLQMNMRAITAHKKSTRAESPVEFVDIPPEENAQKRFSL